MLTQAEALTLLISVAALLVSGYLALLRWRDTRAKPELRLTMDWMQAEGEATTLRLIVSNHGKARGGVRDVLLSPSERLDRDAGFYYLALMDQMPVMVDPGELARFAITVDPNGTQTFTRGLLDGTFTHAILIDHDQQPTPFPFLSGQSASRTERARTAAWQSGKCERRARELGGAMRRPAAAATGASGRAAGSATLARATVQSLATRFQAGWQDRDRARARSRWRSAVEVPPPVTGPPTSRALTSLRHEAW